MNNIRKGMNAMIGIIGAMIEEVEGLKALMQDYRVERHASRDFYIGSLEGKEAVVVQCGIGKVNAAVAAEVLAEVYKCKYIINTGIAGSLNKDIDIGDIVLSTDSVQHDMDVTGLGYERGIIPDQDTSYYKASDELRHIAKAACEKVNPDIKVFEGRVVSGDQFISGKEVKDDIVKTFNGMCTEMEGAAIAQVAWLNNVPYLVIRAISDKADDSAEMDYPSFKIKAIDHSVRLVKEMIKNI
jgi:5''-methylthioadenosine/S-adenosylhomocysteine nucleosidase